MIKKLLIVAVFSLLMSACQSTAEIERENQRLENENKALKLEAAKSKKGAVELELLYEKRLQGDPELRRAVNHNIEE